MRTAFVQLQAGLFFYLDKTRRGVFATLGELEDGWVEVRHGFGKALCIAKLSLPANAGPKTTLENHSQTATIENVTAGSHTADRLHRLRNLRPA